jgi:hypothetical protein
MVAAAASLALKLRQKPAGRLCRSNHRKVVGNLRVAPACVVLPGPSPPLATMQRALVRAPGAAAAAAGGAAPSRRRAVAARPATALLASSSSSASRAGRAAPAPGRAPAGGRRAGGALRTASAGALSDAGMDGDLAAVRKLLASNAKQLAQPTPGVRNAGDEALQPEEMQARMAALMDEERRLASLEAQLAGAERGLSASERELLQQLLARQKAASGVDMSAQTMKARLGATEAEAAVRGAPCGAAKRANARSAATRANKPRKAVDTAAAGVARVARRAPRARRAARAAAAHAAPPPAPRRVPAGRPAPRTPNTSPKQPTRAHAP